MEILKSLFWKPVGNMKKISRQEYDSWRRTEILLRLCVKYGLLSEGEAKHAWQNNGELPPDIWARVYKASISKN